MVIRGRFRLSFNRNGAAPLVWSVCPLDSDGVPLAELAVRRVTLERVIVETCYAPKETPDDDDGVPSAYLVCHGTLQLFGDGSVIISPLSQSSA